MALAPIAPWVVPPNYLGAAEAGARTGLEARGQDIQYQEAGDRLRLAYDQLAAEEKARARESASKLQLAQASLALKGQQLSLLDQYRQAQIGNQQQRMADLMGFRSAELGQRQEAMGQREQAATAADTLRRENLDLRREALETRGQKEAQVEVPVDPANPFGAKIKGPLSDPEIKRLYDAAQKRAQAPAGAQPTGFSLLHPSTWLGRGAANAPAAPFKEGALIRNKSTGKLYKVINGEPQEVEGNAPNQSQ